VLARVNTHLSLRSMQRKLEAQNRELRAESDERRRVEQSLTNSYAELKETHEALETLHQQLLQSEKMASIGQLAAGVAHEINNPIAFVNSNLGTLKEYVDNLWELVDAYAQASEALQDRPDLFEPVRRMRDSIDVDYLRKDLESLMVESLDGVARVRRIVQDLKDFSHVGEVERQSFDLHAGIDSTLNIVWHELKQKAEVIKEYGTIPMIDGVPAQLNQVFMNLLVNAAQALDHYGVITIRTGREGDWVWAEVADDGPGIKPEHLPRIFEPFFTTKPVGKGTGLGLSLSYGIVSQHGGRIEVDSTVGNGTRFRVWLPIGKA
jgi:two-component system, NtrC family, sensor kinase